MKKLKRKAKAATKFLLISIGGFLKRRKGLQWLKEREKVEA